MLRTFRDYRLVLVVALAVGLWWPLFQVDWFWAHEKSSYILRTVEWATEMSRGEVYPRWCPDLYGGYGSPLYMFYAPVPYASAGVLTATFFDPITSLKIVVLVGSILSGVGMYALVYGETRQREAALLAALVYLGSPWRLTNLYARGDIGEFTFLGLFPIAIALYRAVALEARPLRARFLAAGATVVHAMLIMTHPIMGMWATLLLGLIVLVSAISVARRGMWRRGLLLVGALVCAPALAGIYIVPAIVYRTASHTDIMVTNWSNPQHQWILIESLFKDWVLGTAMPGKFYKIGPIVVAALVAVAIGMFRNARAARRGLGWMAIVFALLYLTLPEASWFWEHGRIPLVEFTQFPFRLLGPALLTTCLTLGIGAAASFERAPEQLRGAIAIAGGAVCFLGLGLPLLTAEPMVVRDVPSDPDSIRQGLYAAVDEDGYLPKAVPSPPSTPRRDLVLASEGAAVNMELSDGSRHALKLRAERRGATLILALHGFPGWRVDTVSGPGKARLDADSVGRLRLRLPAAGAYRLQVVYGGSAGTRMGTALTVLAALSLCLLLAYGSRLWPPRARTLESKTSPA